MRIISCDQGSPEWFAERAGRPSASNFSSIITTKGLASKTKKAYMCKLAAERITGEVEETYQNAAMSRGIELEPEARKLFEMITDLTVDQVGMCVTDDNRKSCSPDGLIGDAGGLEIKCPGSAEHIKYLVDNKVPTKYYQQVQGSLYVTGRDYWYFFSYYPGLKPLIIKATPDVEFITQLDVQMSSFCDDLDKLVVQISS